MTGEERLAPPAADDDQRRALAIIAALSVVVVLAVALVIYGLPARPPEGRAGMLPTVNAVLNTSSAFFLLMGFVLVKKGYVRAHRRSMLAAAGVSAAFLVTYLIHHAQVGSVPFLGEGVLRSVYYAILVPHIVLAAAVVPLVLLTLYRGLTERVAQHRRIARITLPLWLYVSVSGVLVYVLQYHVAH